MTEKDPSFRWDDVRVNMSTYSIQGATGEWEVVIGLEVHAYVLPPMIDGITASR